MPYRSPGYPRDCVQDFIWPDPSECPILAGAGKIDERVRTSLSSAFADNYAKQQKWERDARSTSFKSWGSLSHATRMIAEHGSAELQVPTRDLKECLQGDIDSLLNVEPVRNYRAYDRSKEYGAGTPCFNTVRKILGEHGVFTSAADYFGFQSMNLALVTLHVAKPGDVHLYQVFSDSGYKTDLYNMHFDPKAGTMKCILYLNQVGVDDGPFSYVPQSHRWAIPEETRLAAKANCTGNYLDTPEKRSFFMSLPEHKRVTSIFGPLCTNGSEVNKTYHDLLEPFTSEDGNLIVFDPAMIHVGGACTTGTRINLQIALRR